MGNLRCDLTVPYVPFRWVYMKFFFSKIQGILVQVGQLNIITSYIVLDPAYKVKFHTELFWRLRSKDEGNYIEPKLYNPDKI